jgi:Ankyrin repeats (3 copies)
MAYPGSEAASGASVANAGRLLELQQAAVPELQALVFTALLEVCGDAVAPVLARPREAVRLTGALAAPDLSCHAPVAAWLHLRAVASAAAGDGGNDDGACVRLVGDDAPGTPRALRVAVRTSLGALRTRVYDSAASLADDALACIPSGPLNALVAAVRVAPGGLLQLTTRAAFAAATAEGRLHCGLCGRFLLGARGLRDHVQVHHSAGYCAAREAVCCARRTLALAPGCARELHAFSLAAAEAASLTRAARDALPEGLQAARAGDTARLRQLVADGWVPQRCSDRHGSTALLWAAGEGHVSTVAFLVDECGCDPAWAQPRDGRTAMHWAARNGHLSVCRWLLARGVDSSQATRDGTHGVPPCFMAGRASD